MGIMKKFKTQTASKIPTSSKGTVFVIAAEHKADRCELLPSALEVSPLVDLNALGLTTNPESTISIPGSDGAVIGVVVLPLDTENIGVWRSLGGVIARNFGLFTKVVVDLPFQTKEQLIALAEGFNLGLYEFQSYKSKPEQKLKTESLTFISDFKLGADDLERIEVVRVAVHASRDLVNQPANDLYPASFEVAAKAAVEGLPLALESWDEKALVKGGFGGISAVGMGSSRPPRLIKVAYTPKGAKGHIALVGKGITFDTGGLSLKPAESMVGMKYDMTGAATVLQAIVAIAKLGINIRVTAWMCLAENMPSGTATRPNDVIKARNGKTIEVLNTDAEGRLVLADGLSIASEEHPDLIVDVATLTGAATIALGNRIAGLMGDDSAVEEVRKAANMVDEPVWHMPLPSELRPLLNSDIADIANVKIGNRAGGMLIGGLFLREFVGKQKKDSSKTIPWAHLDIAGPSDNSSSAYGFTPKGATGTMVRTLIELVDQRAR